MTLGSDGATAIAPTEEMSLLPSVMLAQDWPAVGGFPDAAIDGAEVEHERLARIARHSVDAAAAVRADAPPAERRKLARKRGAIGCDDLAGARRGPGA